MIYTYWMGVSEHEAGDVVKVKYLNSFIISVCKVMQEMCMIDFTASEPVFKKVEYLTDSSLVKIDFISDFSGEFILNINHDTALELISNLLIESVNTIDELGKSAISELGNIIAGNAATVFANKSGVVIYITPPSYYIGKQYNNAGKELLSIPFSSEIGDLSVDIFVNEWSNKRNF